MINNRVFLKENMAEMGLFTGIIHDFRQIDGDGRVFFPAVKGNELNIVCLILILN